MTLLMGPVSGSTPILKEAPKFDHPFRGTCNTECPLYGYCHCGCGEKTAICKRNYFTKNMHANMHQSWIVGHHLYAHVGRVHRVGSWSVHGVDVERAVLVLNKLHEEFGTWVAVSRFTGINLHTIHGYKNYNRRGHKKLSIKQYEKILKAYFGESWDAVKDKVVY